MSLPPLKPLHPDGTLILLKLEQFRKLTTAEKVVVARAFRIIKSKSRWHDYGRTSSEALAAEVDMIHTIYWIEGPWSGRLAILPRPRGSEWLEDELLSLKHAGFDVIVSLLTFHENAELDLQDEAELAVHHGLQFLSFPIDDRRTPHSFRETQKLVEQLVMLLTAGKQVGIHCRQGVGRSALLAASVLVHAGADVDEVFARIEAARGCSVPDTEEQRQWVERFAALEALSVL